MYAGAEREREWRRLRYTPLRDCKYELKRARTSPLAHSYARAVRASCLLRTHERDGDTAQWRNNRVNGRTDVAMRKNLAGIGSPGINMRATAPTKAREPRFRREDDLRPAERWRHVD